MRGQGRPPAQRECLTAASFYRAPAGLLQTGLAWRELLISMMLVAALKVGSKLASSLRGVLPIGGLGRGRVVLESLTS
jgi:hypothetical protein